MQVVADVCVIPIKNSDSLAEDIAICQRILQRRGLNHKLHAYGTNVEGDWDEVMAAFKEFHTALHERGIARISSTLKIGTRTDQKTDIVSKIERVEVFLQAEEA